MAKRELSETIPNIETSNLSPDDPVEKIVQENFLKGRFARVCKYQGGTLTLENYRATVALYYAEHHPLITQLHANDPEAWARLWQRLFGWAYRLLCNWGWSTDQAYPRAQEAAQEACLSIQQNPYPYDCPFDAWIYKILRDHIFRSYHRPRNPLDIPGMLSVMENQLGLPETDSGLSAIEPYTSVRHALNSLRSEVQREVIESLFLKGYSVEETARRLNKSVQAIYNLKGRALDRLRSLLLEDQREENKEEKKSK